MKLVKYVGVKARRRDNLAHSGLVWAKDQVHGMEDYQADVLLAYPEWEQVYPEPAVEESEETITKEVEVTPRAPATSNFSPRRKPKKK